jgi:uncharacterized membrane protein HdeD (DUF308 family)
MFDDHNKQENSIDKTMISHMGKEQVTMVETLSKNWWMLALRGVFAIIFGVLALIWPGITLITLVLLFGIYVLIDGVTEIVTAVKERDQMDKWWWLLLEGIAGVIAGIVAFIWPDITAVVLLYIIAVWAIISGVFEIAAAIRLRREIDNELLLGLAGVLSILFGIVLIIAPVSGALAIVWLIGIYAIAFGALMIVLAFRIRGMSSEELQDFTRTSPQV